MKKLTFWRLLFLLGYFAQKGSPTEHQSNHNYFILNSLAAPDPDFNMMGGIILKFPPLGFVVTIVIGVNNGTIPYGTYAYSSLLWSN